MTVDPATAPDDKEPGDKCPDSFLNVEVVANEPFLDADFCFKFKPGKIGDTVFCDLNDDGNQDAGEPGIGGVIINLRCAGPDNRFFTRDDIRARQITNADGKYLFEDVPAGRCRVTVRSSSVPDDKERGKNCPKRFNI